MELTSVFLRRSKIQKFEIFITHDDTMTSLRNLVRVFSLDFISIIPPSYPAFKCQ